MKKIILIFFWSLIYLYVVKLQNVNGDNSMKADNKNNINGELNKSLVLDSKSDNLNQIEHNKDTGLLKMNIIIMIFVSVLGTIFLMGSIIFAVYLMHLRKIISFDNDETKKTLISMVFKKRRR
uniref:Plasmodium yoelii subtelomeric region (PYST-C1) n=1 Tax=Strongyloides stercoralis TaxID=6248 RepID=A0A0K0ET95_STRER